MSTINQLWTNIHLQKLSKIGGDEGKNSTVWKAHDTQLNESLVLKEISKQSLKIQNIEDFFLESKLLNKGEHPHIMPIRYASEDDDYIYISMPYYERGSLQSIMEKKMLSVRDIIKYSLDFLNGLLYIHVKRMTHLDIKPTNIIVNDQDRALLTDFGLSRYLESDGFSYQPRQYTIHASPESYNTEDRTVLDDIYQSGLTLYRLCNGKDILREQFEALKQKHSYERDKIVSNIQSGRYPNKSYYLPHIPSRLKRIINKAMHHDPDKRYQNVMEVINSLSKIDENLDWEYTVNESESKHSWLLGKDNNVEVHVTCESDGQGWYTEGRKISPKQIINIKKFNGHFDDLKSAFKHLEAGLSENI